MSSDFILRERTFKETINIGTQGMLSEIRVSRTRTSDGHAAIFLKLGTNKRIEFSNDAQAYGDNYTDVVKTVIALLTKALEDPCSCPVPIPNSTKT